MVEPRSALDGHLTSGRFGMMTDHDTAAGLALGEAPVGALFQIAGWDDFEEALKPGLAALGFDRTGSFRHLQRAGDVQLLRIAPDRIWLKSAAPLALPETLAANDALVWLDLSHARTAIRVEGGEAEALMARLAVPDFRRAAFPPGSFAQTGIHHVGVLVSRIDEDAFEILVPCTWAGSLWDWITANAAPLGYEVRGPAGAPPGRTG